MAARLVSKPTNTLKALKIKLKSPALIDSAGLLFELVLYSGKWTTGSREIAENGSKARKGFEPVAHSVKWTTSSREITRNGSKARKSFEPVAHSVKWTTSSREIAGNVPKVRKSFELVAHSVKWTTGSQKIVENGSKVRKSFEPVAYSGKWATSSGKRQGIGRFSRDSGVASGPLCQVDHWLGQKIGLRADFMISRAGSAKNLGLELLVLH